MPDKVNQEVRYVKRAAQQIIGREGETATLLSRCLLTLKLRVFGFAPRQFGRWAAASSSQFFSFYVYYFCP